MTVIELRDKLNKLIEVGNGDYKVIDNNSEYGLDGIIIGGIYEVQIEIFGKTKIREEFLDSESLEYDYYKERVVKKLNGAIALY